MIDQPPMATLTLTFTDGQVQQFAFTERQGDETQMVSRIKHIIESNCLMLELEDRLLMLPMQNIRAIEISPPPAKLPDTTLKFLRPLG